MSFFYKPEKRSVLLARFGAGTSVAGLHVDALEEVLQPGTYYIFFDGKMSRVGEVIMNLDLFEGVPSLNPKKMEN